MNKVDEVEFITVILLSSNLKKKNQWIFIYLYNNKQEKIQ